MFYAHIFLNGEIHRRAMLEHCPRLRETVRISEDMYAKVTEVVWCFDEPDGPGQRVNIRLESLDLEES